MNEEEARKRVRELKGFHGHLVAFIATTGMCFMINLVTYLNGVPVIWALYPFVSWGPFVFLHWLGVSGRMRGGADWEEQKVRELTGWSATQEELSRLSERIDTLMKILSDVDWEAFGADLKGADETLRRAKTVIERQRAPRDDREKDVNKEKVVQLIEKLEALVTSAEFRHYEELHSEADDKKPEAH